MSSLCVGAIINGLATLMQRIAHVLTNEALRFNSICDHVVYHHQCLRCQHAWRRTQPLNEGTHVAKIQMCATPRQIMIAMIAIIAMS